MPPLPGFSDNQFSGYADFKQACISLLRQLTPYQSPGGARIKLPLSTGTHFDEVAAQLEGYARPLWAVGALVHNGDLTEEEKCELVDPYVRGLANGTDPGHEEYWGPVVVRDQRMVEMEIISFGLLVAPDVFYRNQSTEAQNNITTWLNTLNGKDFPATNWLWFRVMTNLALVKVCGITYEELKPSMDADLDQMEQFYMDEGWAADGIWDDNGRQADYYSGSFAIQFSQLLYVKMAEDLDPARCSTFRDRAAAFAASFWRYFDSNGAAIPFGRSLTYRFAFAGFWSSAAFAEVELPAPLNDLGVVKGLLLRHFRWWSKKHDIFNIDGTLTIGFTYPNMYMAEDYNSPQSPYWAMKSFVALGLPLTHPFWTAEEKPLPKFSLATLIKPPMQIVCNTGNHHFLLSAGQFCPWPLKATEAKYCKFAYSSHFGFSVPTGSSVLAQMALDSTIALSKDGGDTWRVPWRVREYSHGLATLINRESEGETEEQIPTLRSVWKPWQDSDLEVTTTLIAPCNRWPDWHVRIHKVTNWAPNNAKLSTLAVEGGFAIQGRGAKFGKVLPAYESQSAFEKSSQNQESQILEATLSTPCGALICSDDGASGIRPLSLSDKLSTSAERIEGIECGVMKPDSNTNLMWQRTLIPTMKVDVSSIQRNSTATFASAVFAISRNEDTKSQYKDLDIPELWRDVPVVRFAGQEKPEGVTEYIRID